METTDANLTSFVRRAASVAVKAYKLILEHDDGVYMVDVHLKGPFGGISIRVER